MLRAWNPRLNPLLRPDEWDRVARRNRRRVVLFVCALTALALVAAGYRWYPRDLTKGLPPETVVERAGLALLQAGQYRFQLALTGASRDYAFPGAEMAGAYQRSPAVLHLAGTVDAGESRLPLEYYLEGQDVYLRSPVRKDWLLLRGTPLDELTSFLPENLAAPMLGGVRHVEELGRERLPGGPAIRYRLDLDPDVMLPRQRDLRSDEVSYTLWVYTRTLEPARFAMHVVRQQPEAGKQPAPTGESFTYELTWEFRGLKPLAVPVEVKATAQDVGGEVPPGGP